MSASRGTQSVRWIIWAVFLLYLCSQVLGFVRVLPLPLRAGLVLRIVVAVFTYVYFGGSGSKALGWTLTVLLVPVVVGFLARAVGSHGSMAVMWTFFVVTNLPMLGLVLQWPGSFGDRQRAAKRPAAGAAAGTPASRPAAAPLRTSAWPSATKAVEPPADAALKEAIARNGLRPLGNKKRLGFGEDKDCLDYRAQFRDRGSALAYYKAFLSHASKNPPPVLIEVIVAFTPNTIYSEKYSMILPYFNVGAREDYSQWARNAIMSSNDTLRQHSYSAGNSYSYVPSSIGAQGAVIEWTIVAPRGFDPDSPEGQELLVDPPDGGYKEVAIEGRGVALPDKPDPCGPWIGVLFEISAFSEALYGRAATKLLLEIVGLKDLSGCVIHGGDVLPECKYWCNAVHTGSQEQAELIQLAVLESENGKLAHEASSLLTGGEVPVNTLPFQGFVSKDGKYVGV